MTRNAIKEGSLKRDQRPCAEVKIIRITHPDCLYLDVSQHSKVTADTRLRNPPGSPSLSLNLLQLLSPLIENHFTSNCITTFAKGSTGYYLVSINLKVNHEINKWGWGAIYRTAREPDRGEPPIQPGKWAMDLPPAAPVLVAFKLSASEKRIENQLEVSRSHFQGAKISEIWVRGDAKKKAVVHWSFRYGIQNRDNVEILRASELVHSAALTWTLQVQLVLALVVILSWPRPPVWILLAPIAVVADL